MYKLFKVKNKLWGLHKWLSNLHKFINTKKKSYFKIIKLASKLVVIVIWKSKYSDQTKTGLGLKVYPFTIPGCCTAYGKMLQAMLLSQHWALSFKTVKSYVPCNANAWGMLLGRDLWFVQWHQTCNPVKERDPFLHGCMKLQNTGP